MPFSPDLRAWRSSPADGTKKQRGKEVSMLALHLLQSALVHVNTQS
jgi:hypothetical protein